MRGSLPGSCGIAHRKSWQDVLLCIVRRKDIAIVTGAVEKFVAVSVAAALSAERESYSLEHIVHGGVFKNHAMEEQRFSKGSK